MKNILRNSNLGLKNWIVRMALLRSEPRELNRSFGVWRVTRHAIFTTILALGWGGAAQGFAQAIVGWDVNGLSAYGVSPFAPGTSDANLTVVGLTRGTGVGTAPTAAGNAWGGTDWNNGSTLITTQADAISTSHFVTFSITPKAGYQMSLSSISAYNIRRTGTGPTTGIWQYSLDGTTFNNIGTAITWGSTTTSPGNSQGSISLSGISPLQNVAAGTTVTFRVVNWGASSSGAWYFNNLSTVGNDLVINGTVSQASSGSPVITSPTTASATAFVAFEYQITADNSPSSFTATGLPTGLSINTSTGLISGTVNTPGTYNISITASNGSGTGGGSFSLTVGKNPGAPTISSLLTAAATAGSVFNYTIEASNTPTSYTTGTLPAGLTLDPATGIISGTPTAGGVSNITITALNALGQDSQTLVLTTSAPPTITSSTSGSSYEAGNFSYTVAATATPAVTAYGATGLPDGLVIDPATGIISGSVATAGTYSFTVSADNGIGVGTATYTLRVLSQAEQDAVPLNVVINKYVNASPDKVELLVVGNGTVGSTVDMRGMIIKDHGTNMAVDAGGKFVFANNSLWQSVPAGTLIVLSAGTTAIEDVTVGGSDFNLAVNLGNSTYFTATGGFDIATTEMVVIKAAGTGVDGVAGGIHALAGGTAGARYTDFTGKKLRATGTSGTSIGVYVNNASSVLDDYSLADGTGATGGVGSASLTFGSFNTAGNDSFIKTLRGIVDGTGIASIVNGLSGSPYLGKNVFARNQLAQTVEVVFTPSGSATAIQQLEIDVPALFGVPAVANVTVSGTGTETATPGVVGQKVTISNLNALNPNPVTVRIAGLSSPDTSDAVTNNGSYTFNIRSAGVGGSLAVLGVSPVARVIIPIANLKNVDPTTRVPVLSGQTVAVEGVCLVGRLGTGNTSTVLQEGTAGVQVYSLTAVVGPQVRGNKYMATGTVGQFIGVTQLTLTDAAQMVDLGADTLPTPQTVTVPVFNAAPETYENRLIRIEGLTYVSGTFGNNQNVVFRDGLANQVTVRIQSASTALAQPNGTVTITGIGGQFDTASPFDTGYQLQPRDIDDMPAPPSITTTTFTGRVGEVFSSKVSYVGSSLITAGSALPAGLSLDSATGWITGAPTSATVADLPVSFSSSNAYGTTTVDISFAIQKGTSTITAAPTATAITEGQALSASTLTGGTASVAGAFSWTTPSTVPAVGTASYGVTFTPTDTANYNTATTTVSVTVNAAPVGSTYSEWLNGATPSDAAFLDYVFGAVTPGTLDPSLKPSVAVTGGNLVLTYYVRQGTIGLTVTPKTSADLAAGPSGWSETGVVVADVGTATTVNGVSVQQKTASVPVSGAKKFLRVEAVQQ